MIAVVPAYNAAETIGPLVTLISKQVSQVWVGDDGSTDATAQTARAAGATLIAHPQNRGKGAMLRTLFSAALHENVPALICLDADGQHDPRDIPLFLSAHEQHPEDILIGNRIRRAGVMPPLRRWAVALSSAWISALIGSPLPDAQCGFRLLTRQHLLRVPTRTDRFVMETEFLVRASQRGIAISSVPIHASYPPHNTSHFRAWRDSLSIGWWLCRWALTSGSARAHRPDPTSVSP
jgi:glycosyltransferase involved in cell wall biosynthesis